MPDPVPDYQDPPPPPRDDRGMGQAFAIALGGCALLAALGYAVEAAEGTEAGEAETYGPK